MTKTNLEAGSWGHGGGNKTFGNWVWFDPDVATASCNVAGCQCDGLPVTDDAWSQRARSRAWTSAMKVIRDLGEDLDSIVQEATEAIDEDFRASLTKSLKENAPAWRQLASEPHRCPVCDGRGTVPLGFYDGTMQHPGCTTSSVPPTEPCRACSQGLVWS